MIPVDALDEEYAEDIGGIDAKYAPKNPAVFFCCSC